MGTDRFRGPFVLGTIEDMDVLKALLEQIDDLKTAKELLERVWVDIGPYQHDKASDKTMRDLQRYFKFDDSE